MRELKFRAWNKLAHKMADITAIDFQFDSYRARAGKSSGSGHLTDIDLLEWTGLKDSHGKEIYEGDIVKWMIFPESEDGSTDAKFVVDVVECGEVTGIFATRKRHEIIGLMPPYRHIEVIGNIYETPELIKD